MARSWKDVRADRDFTAEDEARIAEIREQMTPEEEHTYYADPANREPQGPPVRRDQGLGKRD